MTDAHAPHEVEGIELLGSEMLTWSDFDGETGAFGGRVAVRLLDEVPSGAGRVLIAGPHTSEVVADIRAQGHRTDVLVRSWLDAKRLRSELPDDVGVFCGPLDRLDRPEGGYAAVVAAAGLDRLVSAEEDRPGWRTILARLIELVSDPGDLLLGLGNEVGIDRLLSLTPQARHHDADWPEGRVELDAAPTPDAVRTALAEHEGVREVRSWACHGRRAVPSLAVPSDVLAAATDDLLVRRLVGAAYAEAGPASPLLKDPVTTAADLTRSGLAASTAPVTIIQVHAGEVSDDSVRPVLLTREPGDDTVTLRYTLGDDGWARDVLDGDTQTQGTVTREPERLVGPVPSLPTLAEELETACAAGDVRYAGELVRAYRAWLSPDPSDDVPAERLALRFADLTFADGRVGVLDGSRVSTSSAPADVVMLRTLLDAAASLLARGVRHPWEESVTPRAAAAALAAATDLEATAADLDAATNLDAELRGAPAPWDFAVALAGRRAPTYAELAEQVDQLAERATAADQHIAWLLRNIQARQRAIRRSRGKVAALEHSREFRVGRQIFRVRDKTREWEKRLEERKTGKRGEWRDRSAIGPKPEESQIESSVIPPGLTPPDELTVVPDDPREAEKPKRWWDYLRERRER